MPGPDVHPESWFDSAAVRAIGPVQEVYRPPARSYGGRLLVWFVAAVFAVGWLPLMVVLFLDPCSFGGPFPVKDDWLGPIPASVLCVFVPVGLVVLLAVMTERFRRALAVRLLVGERGLVRWDPAGPVVVLWDDLGTVWVCRPVPGDPTGVALCHVDGVRVEIDRTFADYELAVGRVLAEMARALDRTPAPRRPRRPPEGIRPDEPGIAEPRP